MAEQDCIFCKIVTGEIPAKKEYEDEEILVFHDIKPKAPFHVLIIPKEHITDFMAAEMEIWKKMAQVAQSVIKKKNLKGYRLVNNGGEAALVQHLHMHLLGDVSADREV